MIDSLNKLFIFLLFMISMMGVKETAKPVFEIATRNYQYEDYDKAEAAKSYLKFVGKSTKLGLVTTSFTGQAKQFDLTFKRDGRNADIVSQITLQIKSDQVDTDSSKRNEKMYTKCLKVKDYPIITAVVAGPITLKEVEQATTEVQLTILNTTLKRTLTYSIKKEEGWLVHFNTDFSFKEAGIEDPSIFVASVDEIFKIEGQLLLEAKK